MPSIPFNEHRFSKLVGQLGNEIVSSFFCYTLRVFIILHEIDFTISKRAVIAQCHLFQRDARNDFAVYCLLLTVCPRFSSAFLAECSAFPSFSLFLCSCSFVIPPLLCSLLYPFFYRLFSDDGGCRNYNLNDIRSQRGAGAAGRAGTLSGGGGDGSGRLRLPQQKPQYFP